MHVEEKFDVGFYEYSASGESPTWSRGMWNYKKCWVEKRKNLSTSDADTRSAFIYEYNFCLLIWNGNADCIQSRPRWTKWASFPPLVEGIPVGIKSGFRNQQILPASAPQGHTALKTTSLPANYPGLQLVLWTRKRECFAPWQACHLGHHNIVGTYIMQHQCQGFVKQLDVDIWKLHSVIIGFGMK